MSLIAVVFMSCDMNFCYNLD